MPVKTEAPDSLAALLFIVTLKCSWFGGNCCKIGSRSNWCSRIFAGKLSFCMDMSGGLLRICCTESECRTPHVKKAMCTLWQSQDSVNCESTGDFAAVLSTSSEASQRWDMVCMIVIAGLRIENSKICPGRIVEPVGPGVTNASRFS